LYENDIHKISYSDVDFMDFMLNIFEIKNCR